MSTQTTARGELPADADASAEEFGEGGIGLSEYRYPTGWFVVSWSTDVEPGQVKLVHYFGEDLVVFRGEDGRVYVLEAYCRHLGGNLGVGGTVEGSCIRCPWHGWLWHGEDGTNAEIPYSKLERNPRVQVPPWHAREWYGMILVWHDRHRRPPYWEPPTVPEVEGDDYYPMHPHTRMLHRVKVHPQMIVENAADPYHVERVHGGYRPAVTSSFQLRGHRLHATVNANFGGGRESTWLTPEGPVDGEIVYDNYSLGLGFVRFPDNVIGAVQITGQTPVDEDYTDYFFVQALPREPGDTGEVPAGKAAKFLKLQQEVIKQDFFTWENMKYLEKPNLAPEEAKDYAALRRWAHRFYPGPTPSSDDFGYSEESRVEVREGEQLTH